MKCVFILILILIVCTNGEELEISKSEQLLPCVYCKSEDKPVCARPTRGGPHQTFESRCLVQSMDCGYSEHRKNLILMNFQNFVSF